MRPQLHARGASPMNKVVPAHTIGDYVPMIDGPEKVSGRAKYTADFVGAGHARGPHLPQPLFACRNPRSRCVGGARSCRACAPSSPAPIATRASACCRSRAPSIRWRASACVIAASRSPPWRRSTMRPRREALRRIKLKVRELPAYYTAQDGDGARRRRSARAPAAAISSATCYFELGDVEAGFRRKPIWCAKAPTTAPRSARTRWRCTPRSPITTRVRERMTVHASTQVPYYVHLMLSQILGMDMSRIRVVKPHVGGGFGCRTETLNVELIAALLGAQGRRLRAHSWSTARRPSSPIAAGRRPISGSSSACARTAASPRSNANASSAAARIRGYGVVTILYSGSMLYAIYDLHNVKYIGKRVLTNTPPCGAFRGHGTVDVRFAFESLLDEMAQRARPRSVRRAPRQSI